MKHKTNQNLNEALTDFYRKNGFGPEIGKRIPLTVKVYTGCMLVPLPNIETRRKYLKFHDLHHLITKFSVGRIGEGKVSAWELGTGALYYNLILGCMNLIALSTGLFLKPKDMWEAFILGKRSKNLYKRNIRKSLDFDSTSLEKIRNETINCYPNKNITLLTKIEFAFYSAIAIFIHIILVIPAIILRTITDLIETGSVIETINPKKRSDIF